VARTQLTPGDPDASPVSAKWARNSVATGIAQRAWTGRGVTTGESRDDGLGYAARIQAAGKRPGICDWLLASRADVRHSRSWRSGLGLIQAVTWRFDVGSSSSGIRLIMTNATITRPEWSTVIDPILQKELEQHVLVTNWDKLLGIVDTVYNWGGARRSGRWASGWRAVPSR